MSVVCQSVRVRVSANMHPHFVLTYAFVLYWKKGCLGKESKVARIELRAPHPAVTPPRGQASAHAQGAAFPRVCRHASRPVTQLEEEPRAHPAPHLAPLN